MQTSKHGTAIPLTFLTASLLFACCVYFACQSDVKPKLGAPAPGPAPQTITISSTLPADIFSDGTPASQATLSQAAVFAWKEFIALNWPALNGTRDTPDNAQLFGSNPGAGPLVWHTFRHKVEIYPGNGKPPAGYDPSKPDYGYNTPTPAYFYDPAQTGTPDGQVSPCGTPSPTAPWINLDENNEIGVTTMFAGTGGGAYPGQQFLFLAKANQAEYVYAAKTGWYAGGAVFNRAKTRTVNYINQNSNTPPSSYDTTYVSLPPGTVEMKTAWRRLTAAEQSSGRFFSTTVRYYSPKVVQNGGKKDTIPCYIDEVFGMMALHIIHKTPTAPYFIFATFEQTDNILTTSGAHVEDENGNVIANQDSTPMTPNFKVTNATPTAPQMFSPTTANSKPGQSLYYQNVAGGGIPTGTVTINKRINPIPSDIIAANSMAHDAIIAYNQKNGLTKSPWQYYKLVNVQYKPYTKQPGVDYSDPATVSTYYMANSVVESDYILQKFSGKFSSDPAAPFTITDYTNTSGGVAYNAYYNGKNLMGGCMGCHGNATNGGTDYSFILGRPVGAPTYAQPLSLSEAKMKLFTSLLSPRR